jgi:hypothetical protein
MNIESVTRWVMYLGCGAAVIAALVAKSATWAAVFLGLTLLLPVAMFAYAAIAAPKK